MTIRIADGAADMEAVRGLWRRYWDSLGLGPEFQGFEEELRGLPGAYGPHGGILLIADEAGTAVGTAALRRLSGEACEAKRLYVASEQRGQGIGAALLERIVAEARALGYRDIYGDTLPSMTTALAMYRRFGFEMTAPYSASPTPGAVYLKLHIAMRKA